MVITNQTIMNKRSVMLADNKKKESISDLHYIKQLRSITWAEKMNSCFWRNTLKINGKKKWQLSQSYYQLQNIQHDMIKNLQKLK